MPGFQQTGVAVDPREKGGWTDGCLRSFGPESIYMMHPYKGCVDDPRLLTFTCSEKLALNPLPCLFRLLLHSVVLCFSWESISPFKNATRHGAENCAPDADNWVLAPWSSHCGTLEKRSPSQGLDFHHCKPGA